MADRVVTVLFKTVYDDKGLKQAESSMKSFGAKTANATRGNISFGRSITAMAATLYTLKSAFEGVKTAFNWTQEMAALGTTSVQVRESFMNLNDSLNISPELLKDMQEASRGTVSEMQLMESYLTLVAGTTPEFNRVLADASPKLVELAKAAQKLNPALGDVPFLFDSLARGIKRAEIRVIDNIGLNVKVGEANKRFADSLGKTVEALTAEEKQMALLNEVLRVGDNLIKQAGDSTDAYGDKLQQLTVLQQELTREFAEAFGMTLIEGMQDAQIEATALAEDLSQIAVFAAEATTALANFVQKQADLSAGRDVAKQITSLYDENADFFLSQGLMVRIKAMQTAKYAVMLDETGTSRAADDVQRYADALERLVKIDPAIMAADLETLRDAVESSADGVDAVAFRWLAMGEFWMNRMRGTARTAVSDVGYDDTAGKLANLADSFEMSGTAAAQASIGVSKYLNEQKALYEQTQKNAEEMDRYADSINAAYAEIGNIFSEQIGKADGTGFVEFKERFVTEGGLVGDAKSNYDELIDARNRAKEQIRSLTGGVAGLGLEEEELNKRLDEQHEILRQADEAIAAYGDNVKATTTKVGEGFEFNFDAIKSGLFDAAQDADIGPEILAQFGVGLGELTEDDAIGGLMSTGVDLMIKDIVRKLENGDITITQAIEEYKNIPNRVGAIDWKVLVNPVVEIRELTGGEQNLASKLFTEEGELEAAMGFDTDPAEESLLELLGLAEEAEMIIEPELDTTLAQEVWDEFVAGLNSTQITVDVGFTSPSVPSATSSGYTGGYAAPLDVNDVGRYSAPIDPTGGGYKAPVDEPQSVPTTNRSMTVNQHFYNKDAAAIAMMNISQQRRAAIL